MTEELDFDALPLDVKAVFVRAMVSVAEAKGLLSEDIFGKGTEPLKVQLLINGIECPVVDTLSSFMGIAGEVERYYIKRFLIETFGDFFSSLEALKADVRTTLGRIFRDAFGEELSGEEWSDTPLE